MTTTPTTPSLSPTTSTIEVATTAWSVASR